MRFLKAALAVFIVTLALGVSLSYCADKPAGPAINHFEGRISYIDWVASRMIVDGVGRIEFHVTKDIKVRKLGNSITFANLNLLDDVIVDYYEGPSGGYIVTQITVKVV